MGLIDGALGVNKGLTIGRKWGVDVVLFGRFEIGGDGFWSYFCADFG